VADQQAIPRKFTSREINFEVSWLARMRQCEQDTKLLIAGARREVASAYELLAEIDQLLARR
jgi:hypothetical protein